MEALVVAALLVAAAGVLAFRGARATRAIAAAALAAAAAGAWLYPRGGDPELAAAVPARVTEGGFATSASCRACHPDAYEAWHDSYHRKMTQVATPAAVLGSFDGVTLEDRGYTWRLERRGDAFWADIPDPLWFIDAEPDRAAAPPRIEARVVMTTGSHHQQKYWVRRPAGGDVYRGLTDNGALVQLPWAWLVDAKRWIPSRDAFLTPPSPEPDTPAVWNTACFPCHSVGTQPHFDEQEVAFDTRSVELGIACEACHGPGEEHVRANASPLRRYWRHLADDGEGDPTIVNPKRLDRERSSQICGQCHSFFRNFDMESWQQTGTPYRAGDDLAKTRTVFRHSHDRSDPLLRAEIETDPNVMECTFWPDGAILVAGREYNGLIESPCYERGEMSCVSCHSMHDYEQTADQLAPGRGEDGSCVECHAGIGQQVAAHTHHAVESEGSRCMNCHMPHTTYGLFSLVRTHRIDNPSVASNLASGRPNACNLCHLDRTLEWTASHLSDWYGQAPVALGEHERSVAAGVDWALRGSVVQRAVVAWHMGWAPAQQASGRTWTGGYLALLLADPYVAVRRVAEKSLETLPGFEAFDFDFVATDALPQKQREAVVRWQKLLAGAPDRSGPHLLLDAHGTLDREAFTKLLSERDARPFRIAE
jgi:hypothetical protein